MIDYHILAKSIRMKRARCLVQWSGTGEVRKLSPLRSEAAMVPEVRIEELLHLLREHSRLRDNGEWSFRAVQTAKGRKRWARV